MQEKRSFLRASVSYIRMQFFGRNKTARLNKKNSLNNRTL